MIYVLTFFIASFLFLLSVYIPFIIVYGFPNKKFLASLKDFEVEKLDNLYILYKKDETSTLVKENAILDKNIYIAMPLPDFPKLPFSSFYILNQGLSKKSMIVLKSSVIHQKILEAKDFKF